MKKLIIIAVAFLIASPALFAQTKAGKKDTAQHTVFYTCPTHSSVIINTSGKCPLCGMDLNLSAKEQMKAQVTKTYTCSVNADIASATPGKKLNLSLKEQMKMEVVKLNGYPVHSDVASSKSGKCPKCGMTLTKNRKTMSDRKIPL